jgi:hypothetical protein
MNTTQIKLQEKGRALVEREVFCHVGGLIDEIQEAHNKCGSFFEWQTYAFECEPTDEQVAEYIRDNTTKDYTPDEDEARGELTYQEIFEYWAISEWLADHLKEQGEAVATFGLTNVWGRRTTGQAIALDYVIEKIVTATGYASWLDESK